VGLETGSEIGMSDPISKRLPPDEWRELQVLRVTDSMRELLWAVHPKSAAYQLEGGFEVIPADLLVFEATVKRAHANLLAAAHSLRVVRSRRSSFTVVP
jgi:hypothetical protein